MGREMLSPQVAVVEGEAKPRRLPSFSVSVVGAVGLTEKGPLNQPVLCTTFQEFEQTFGGLSPSSDLSLAAMGFFENGGRQLWVSRVRGPDVTPASLRLNGYGIDPLPAVVTGTIPAPFAFEQGDSIAFETETGVSTVTFFAYPAHIESGRTEPYRLADGFSLIVGTDGGPNQTITFRSDQFTDIAAATAAEVVAAIQSQLTGAVLETTDSGGFTMTSATRGTGSGLDIVGGEAAGGPISPRLQGTVPLPIALNDGDVLQLEANGHSYTILFTGTKAVMDSSDTPKVEPFMLDDGQTAVFQIDGGDDQTVTFTSDQFADITAATAAEVAAVLQSQLTGVVVDTTPSGGIRLTTIVQGWRARIQTMGGTALDGPTLPASALGTVPVPIALDDGDVLQLDVNGHSYTILFSGTKAVMDSSDTPKVEPFVLADGMTAVFQIDGGDDQTVTFTSGQFVDITAATGAEVAAAIQSQLTGVVVDATPSGGIRLTTIAQGTRARIQTIGGTALDGDTLPASVLGTVPLPIALEDGDELHISVNGNPPYTLTFEGTPASIQDPSEVPRVEPFALSNGDTLTFTVDGGSEQTVTFSTVQFETIASASAAEVAAVINAQASGVNAGAAGGAIVITTLSKGTGSNIQVTGGTAASTFGLVGAFGAGDGTVVDLDAVTMDDIGNLAFPSGVTDDLHIDDTGAGVLFETQPWIAGSSATLEITGQVATALGVDTGVHTGYDADRLGIAFQGIQGEGTVPDLNVVTISDIGNRLFDTGATNDVHADDTGTGVLFRTWDWFHGSTVHMQLTGTAATALGFDATVHTGYDSDRLGIAFQAAQGEGTVPDLAVVTIQDIGNRLWETGATNDVQAEDLGTGIVFWTWPWIAGSSVTLQLTGSVATTLGLDPGVVAGYDADILGLLFRSTGGSGDVVNLSAVTIDEVAGRVAAYGATDRVQVSAAGPVIQFSSTNTGPSASLRVTGPDADRMGVDSDVHFGAPGTIPGIHPVLQADAIEPGSYGNRLSLGIFRSPADPHRFELTVYEDRVWQERFEDLSRDEEDPRFVEAIVNDPDTGSKLVQVTSLNHLLGLAPLMQVVTMAGGDDGLSSVTDELIIGDEATATGIYALDAVQDLAILLVPGRATPAVHAAMLAYCEEHRDGGAFAVLDPPAGLSAEAMVTYVTTTASLEGASEYGAIYWPRVRVANPKKTLFGASPDVIVPPSGIVAGVYARVEGSGPGGSYESPAGIDVGRMFGAIGLEMDDALKLRKRDLVYPHRINPLTASPGRPPYIDGGRTLNGAGRFPFVGGRRGVQLLEQGLKRELELVRYRSNTPELRAQVRRLLSAFLIAQTNDGAFQSRDPAKAFYVDVSDALNPPSVIAAGKLVARIGLSINRPGEFIIVDLSQDTRGAESELGAGG